MYDDAECMSTVIMRSLVVFLLVVHVSDNLFLLRSRRGLVDLLMLLLMNFLVLAGRLFLMVDMDGHGDNFHRLVVDINWFLMGLDWFRLNFYGDLVLFRLTGADFLVDELDVLRDGLDNYYGLL